MLNYMGGYVYLICDPLNECYKIGVTRGSIENRIKKLQTGNGSELFIKDYYQSEYPFKLEKLLHAKFVTKKVLNEWYKLDFDDIINFKSTCESYKETLEILMQNPFFNKESNTKF